MPALKNGSTPSGDADVDAGIGATRAFAMAGTSQEADALSGTPTSAPALSNAEQRALKKKLQSTERKMRTLESKVEDATVRLHAADPTDFQALGSIQQEVDDLRMQLEELELVWLETAEVLGV